MALDFDVTVMKNIFLAIILSLMVIAAFAHDPQPGANTDVVTMTSTR